MENLPALAERRPTAQAGEQVKGDSTAPRVVRVAVPAPLRRVFDYLPPSDGPVPRPGCRVLVPFGRHRKVGIVVPGDPSPDLAPDRLKAILRCVDHEPLIDPTLLDLLLWAADYYGHPPGEAIAAALPPSLRQGRALGEGVVRYRLTEAGREADAREVQRRAPRQAAVLRSLAGGPMEVSQLASAGDAASWRDALRRAENNGWVERVTGGPAPPPVPDVVAGPALTDRQRAAAEAIREAAGRFAPFLLFGVTGSGKTEVYLDAIDAVLRAGRQVLVVVPEISLTPQLMTRFRARVPGVVVELHSGLSAGERRSAWEMARDGRAAVVIGTRSAVFAPLKRPGLLIVDEEHDPSLKQQDGFRYSARDLSLVRARREGVPVVLGSATPSLESLHNAAAGRYTRLDLPQRPGAASSPRIRLVDLRRAPATEGLSGPLLEAVAERLDRGEQVMIFINRRGFAPTLFCEACGWSAECPRCDARLTWHRRDARLRCHHCGFEGGVPEECPDCRSAARPAGQGTERVEQALARRFPDVALARIDRDTTRRRGAVEKILADVRSGETRILVGTQMLTKGHDFPGVTLVGVLNADQGLFGTDFRSNERLAQTLVQVAGRAGRGDAPGEVLIQTAWPDHPLLQRLIATGYADFADAALAERDAAHWPPFSHLALLRAEAASRDAPLQFLREVRVLADGAPGVEVLGPAPAPMERRAGRYRAQLLLRSGQRAELHRALRHVLGQVGNVPGARRVRWSVDVDPAELA